jgi:hypothetical protein
MYFVFFNLFGNNYYGYITFSILWDYYQLKKVDFIINNLEYIYVFS